MKNTSGPFLVVYKNSTLLSSCRALPGEIYLSRRFRGRVSAG